MPLDAVAHDVPKTGRVGRDDGAAGGHRLEHDDAERAADRRAEQQSPEA